MIRDLLEKNLNRADYQKIKTDLEQLSMFYKIENDDMYVVDVIDDTGNFLNQPYMASNLVNRSADFFAQKGQYNVMVIAVVITDNINESKSMLVGSDINYWIIDQSNMRLVIYQDQINRFSNLEDIVNITLRGKKVQYDFSLGIVTIILIVINSIIFFIPEVFSQMSQDTIYKYGALIVYEKNDMSQVYRLFTSVFLHFNFTHLLNNMAVLLYLGSSCEKLLGKWKYLVMYLVSGIGANIISTYWYRYIGEINIMSVGASGAIFGVVGALAFIVVRCKGKVGNINARNLAFLIIVTLYHGFWSAEVNNSAHIGGLAVGFFVTALLFKRKDNPKFNTIELRTH